MIFAFSVFLKTVLTTLKMLFYKETRERQKNFIEFDQKSSPGATMLNIPHSLGAIYTRNALIDSSKLIRQRVEVLAVAPGAYIDPHYCHSVRHIESSRDFVPRFDSFGRKSCRGTMTTLKSYAGTKLHDHDFRSPTYQFAIKKRIYMYLSN